MEIKIFVDSDYAGNAETRKLTTCVICTYAGAVIDFFAENQATVALSSAESELYRIGSGTAVGLYLKTLLEELGDQVKLTILCDNSSARMIAQRLGQAAEQNMLQSDIFGSRKRSTMEKLRLVRSLLKKILQTLAQRCLIVPDFVSYCSREMWVRVQGGANCELD